MREGIIARAERNRGGYGIVGVRVLLVDSDSWNIKTARQEGFLTHYANILSSDVMEHLDLDEVGRFLAMTPNDEVTSLAALHFGELFRRASVHCRRT